MKAVNFCTERYVASHGKKPKGRGLWAFEMSVCGKKEQYFFHGTLGEAKRQLEKQVKREAWTHGLEYGPAWADVLP